MVFYTFMNKKTVQDLIPTNINIDHLTIAPHASIEELATKMRDIKSNFFIVQESSTIVGVVSERDIIRKVLMKGLNVEKTQVHEIMITNITSINPQTGIKELIDLFHDRQCRHMPVINFSGELQYILTYADILTAII